MKYLLAAVCSLPFILFFNNKKTSSFIPINKAALAKVYEKRLLTTITCSPDWATYRLTKEEVDDMVPLPGTGSHSWKISTQNDSAQFYFNQGINLYYGFHILEALPSFKKAQLFDSSCAMLYWAEALAYGPNINDYDYSTSPSALIAVSKAKELVTTSTEKERGLIEAMELHYSTDSSQKRAILNQQYAAKMKELYLYYPNDADVGTLYADALMNLHPWDLWQHDGRAKPWTPEINKVLESVLKYAPDHPGANHYYIHTMEASPYAVKALKSADRLAKLAPGLSHIVHMPSHIYIRTGYYSKGIQANIDALKTYNTYLQLYPEVARNAFLYEIHNRHMQAACSINAGDFEAAIKDAIECRNSFDTSFLSAEAPVGPYIQYVFMTPELAMITFKRWNDILLQKNVDSHFHYASLIQQFAKGMAYANLNDIAKAKNSLNKIDELLKTEDIAVVMPSFNAPMSSAEVARYILMGTIKAKEFNTAAALNSFRIAVATEDSLVYNEPRDWLIPARHYLGNFLLDQKKYKEAEEVFHEDLLVMPKNYTSSEGLKAAILYQKSSRKK
ncbi:MAG: hypothetical protein ABIN25_01755 [Ginsengibacter sp.]